MPYQNQIITKNATISSGAALSAAVDIEGMTVLAVVTPAEWTAADISFDKSPDGSTFYPAYDNAAELKINSAIIAVNEARMFSLDPTKFGDAKQIKIRSGLNGAGVNQGANRTLVLVLKPKP